jgi:hypothetical protein
VSYKDYVIHHVPRVVRVDGKVVSQDMRLTATHQIVSIEHMVQEEKEKWYQDSAKKAKEQADLKSETKRLAEEIEVCFLSVFVWLFVCMRFSLSLSLSRSLSRRPKEPKETNRTFGQKEDQKNRFFLFLFLFLSR